MARRLTGVAVAALLMVLFTTGCSSLSPTFGPSADRTPLASTPAKDSLATTRTRLALVTDFGTCDEGERWVAEQVDSWNVDAIVTTGDNTQNEGCVPWQDSVWRYYDRDADGVPTPPFWPTLGNHDYTDPGAGLDNYRRAFPYLSTDADPQQRWYTEVIGLTTIFSLNTESTPEELERQRLWLRETLAAQEAAHPENWNLVLFHRPAYTSGPHESMRSMRPDAGWDFRGWGVDIVLSGHQHVYEDIVVDGLHYVTAGLGGTANARECPEPRREGSRLCLEGTGGMRIDATMRTLTLEYVQSGPAGGPKVTDTIHLER